MCACSHFHFLATVLALCRPMILSLWQENCSGRPALTRRSELLRWRRHGVFVFVFVFLSVRSPTAHVGITDVETSIIFSPPSSSCASQNHRRLHCRLCAVRHAREQVGHEYSSVAVAFGRARCGVCVIMSGGKEEQ